MKTYGGVELQLRAFLSSKLDGLGWLISRSSRFTPGERDPSSHWSRSGRGGEHEKVPRRESKPGRPAYS
jgi:hypothetical protein